MAITLTEMQRSALLEAGNIGSGHAAIALSQLMGRKIMIAIPSIEIVELQDFSRILPDDRSVYIMVSVPVLGDVGGSMHFVMEQEKSFRFCDIVMGQVANTTKKMGTIESSVMKEVGGIVINSYLNAVGDMTEMSISISVPDFLIGGSSDLQIEMNKNRQMSDPRQFMCIETEFIEEEERVDGYLILVPTGDAIGKIIKALKV
jgi:chemotaxis protein CheC